MTQAQAEKATPIDVVTYINQGKEIVDLTLPYVEVLINKIVAFAEAHPGNRLKRIQALEAQVKVLFKALNINQ